MTQDHHQRSDDQGDYAIRDAILFLAGNMEVNRFLGILASVVVCVLATARPRVTDAQALAYIDTHKATLDVTFETNWNRTGSTLQ